MVNQKVLHEYVVQWLEENSLQPAALFQYLKEEEENTDFVITFFQYLISKSIIRYAQNYVNYGIYKFSAPGREIMSDKMKRTVFIEEFVRFYDASNS